MRLIYFDFDHGKERQLSIALDRPKRKIHFCFQQHPDSTYNEDNTGVERVTVEASVSCDELPQFDGFVRALTDAMSQTPFSLQDPDKHLFEAMPHDALELKGISGGVPPDLLKSRIPADIVAGLLFPHYYSDKFRPLITIPKQWKPDRFWYESNAEGDKKKQFHIRFDEEKYTVEFKYHEEKMQNCTDTGNAERTVQSILQCPDPGQMHGLLHALVKAMSDTRLYASAYVLGKFAGKQGGRGFRPAKIEIGQVAAICLKYIPPGVPPDQLKIRLPQEIATVLIPPDSQRSGKISKVWGPLVGE